YLPAGRWTNLLDGTVVEGGRWVREQHGFLSLPLMVRPNTVLPLGAVDSRPDYHYPDGVTFHVFELDEGEEVQTRVPDVKGATALMLYTRREGTHVEFRAEGDAQNWSVLLRRIETVQQVEGGQATPTAEGVRIQPAGSRVVVRL
ncbi:MAG: alpha-xylosidase, partial [Armatimonadetes bacterium]|nr:alpha-xylosidase [Armatimonadota bacterium]